MRPLIVAESLPTYTSAMAIEASLRRVYWEVTAACNLRCLHCRRLDALEDGASDQLSTAEGRRLIDELATFGRPVLIFSGGEPLVRPDLFELAAYARSRHLPIALATNGTLVDAAMARRIHAAGIFYASVSLDGATPSMHNFFRGPGAYEKTLEGWRAMQALGIKVQVNFTVTRQNVGQIQDIYDLVKAEKGLALYLFLLVPVGCGVRIADSQMLEPGDIEDWLSWVADREAEGPLPVRAICAPQIVRVEHKRAEPATPVDPQRRGCLAGAHMCFVSHRGEVFPCGYLPVAAGHLRQRSFRDIWDGSPVFGALRKPDRLKGRCGRCDYRDACGGCRARGYYAWADMLAEEPYCAHQPA